MMSEQLKAPDNDPAKLQRKLAQREAELAILNSVQQALASRLDVQAIYDLVGDKICEIFGAQVVMISTYDPQTETIEHRYAIERGERVYAPGHFPIRGFRTQIAQTRKPVLVNTNVAALAAQLGQPTLPGTITPKSWLGVPMIVGDQVTGILSLQDVEKENAYDDADVRFLETLAASMSVALENASLFGETERLLKETMHRAAELQTINSVQAGLAQKMDMVSIYELVGDKLQEIFSTADVSIGVYDPETGLFSSPYLVENGQRRAFEPFEVKEEGFIAHLLHHPRSMLINERMEQANMLYQYVDATGKGLPKSALYVPLTMGGSMRGAIVLENMQAEHAFAASDVRLLETLANSISVALENAHLWEQEKLYRKALEREFEIGREIQTGFLPSSLPQPKGWEIAASLKSARVVAGDFYDAFELAGGKIGLVIADVCDKGLGAALFMTLFRSLIRMVSTIDLFSHSEYSSAVSAATRLKSTISLTNNYIEKTHGDTGMFTTIFYGILDPDSGLLVYINGGHLPPMLVDRNGVKQTLALTGPAVGVLSNVEYTVREVVIEPGDMLFAYTDGLTDTVNRSGEIFSLRNLSPWLLKEQPVRDLLERIQSQIERFASGVQQVDDITMLAVRRRM